jgi:hypothetical protein
VALVLATALGLAGRTSRLLLATLGGFVLVAHSIVLLAGLAGRLTSGGLALALGGLVLGAGWLARRVRVPEHAERGDGVGRITVAVLLAPAASLVAGVAWAWPHLFGATRLWVWDDYTYHMVYPALWLQERAIAAATPLQAFTMQAWYPLSASVVSTWFMIPFHGTRAEALAWVSLTGPLYVALVAVGIAELLARLGGRPGAWAVPAVLLVTSSRVDVMASSFSDADLAQAALLFAAFVFAVPRSDDEPRRDVTVDAWYAALLSGLALGVKVSVAPQALIVLAMSALRASAGGGSPARVAGIFVAGWAVTAGYWYARNLVDTGNPVYPAAFLAWPGTTFPETTLVEYGRRYGLRRVVLDALAVYARWPWLHGGLAALGLGGLAGWLILRRPASRPCRSFAWGTLAIAVAVVGMLPSAPFSAGNALTFRAGLIHWDSMRYVALLPVLGWTALGFLLDAGAGARGWRLVAAGGIAGAALLTHDNAVTVSRPALVAVAIAVAVVAWWALARVRWRPRTVRRRALSVGAAALVVAGLVGAGHRAKTAATREALYAEPLFGAAAARLDRERPGSRVAVFGDQWIYPAFGDRAHLRPVRLDRDGRLATAPIGAAMEPGDLTVDPATFMANLRASAVDVVVLVRQPHPGRPPDLPPQHAALRSIAGPRLVHQDRAVAIWRTGIGP